MKRRLIAITLPVLMTATLLMAGCGIGQFTANTIPAADTPIPTATPLPPTEAPAPTATMPSAADTPIVTDPSVPPTDAPEPPIWPTRRYWHAMAYDPQIVRVLLFCGYRDRIGGAYYDSHEGRLNAGDEWAYDVALGRWEPLGTTQYATYSKVVYGKQSRRLLGFGPENTVVYNMENRAWEMMEPAVEPPTFRFGHTLTYDSQSDRVILFGGWQNLDDTWAYDFETNTWTEMSPEVSPPHRFDHAMAYDAESDRIILWGASEIGRTAMSEEERATVWVYDYETNTWTAIESTGGPSYRGGHTMVYHPGSDRIILFGGYHQGDVNFSDETWAYDYNANTWTQLDSALHPSGRRFHTMVYAEAADKMILFGGIAGTFLKEEVNDELWIFDPVTVAWSQKMPDSTNP